MEEPSNPLLEEAARLAEQARELQEAAAALLSRAGREEEGLRQRALALGSDLRRIESANRKHGSALDPKIAAKIDEELDRARCTINEEDVVSLLPSKAHGYAHKLVR